MTVDLMELDQAEARTLRRRLQPYHFSELSQLPKRAPVIKRTLDRGAMGIIYGASGDGKTTLATHLAYHVAKGRDWFGRQTQQGAVYYLSAEGGPGSMEKRLAALRYHFDDDTSAPLFVYPSEADLCAENGDTEALIREVAIVSNQSPVTLIVIDTLSRVMAGGNENAPDDMGRLVRNCDRIRNETGAHVLVVHHTGKDNSRGARGHSLLRAAADTEIEVGRDNATETITATITKQRDHELGEPFSFKLETVEVGMDEDGDRITSCVAIPVADPNTTGKRKIGGQPKVALDLLRNATIDQGQAAPPNEHFPEAVKAGQKHVVPLSLWRTYCYAGLLTNGTSDRDKKGSQRRAFNRASKTLQERGFIGVWDDWVWLAD